MRIFADDISIRPDNVMQDVYKNKVYKNAGNKDVLDQVPAGAKSILDVGCGAGDNARMLKELNKHVTCITVSADEATLVKEICDEVIVSNVETDKLHFNSRKFDVIILSHVCEHLVHPINAISKLCEHLSPNGTIVIAVPNMAFYRNRVKLLKGDWTLHESGPFDKTHLHFYSYHSADLLCDNEYFGLKKIPGSLAVPLWPLRKMVPLICKKIDQAAGKLFPNMFAQQVVLVLTKR